MKEKIRPDDSNQCHNLNKVKFDNFLKPCYKCIITDRGMECQEKDERAIFYFVIKDFDGIFLDSR